MITLVQCASHHLWRWIHSELVPIRIRQTGLGVHATNPVSHLVYTFECVSMCITFASVDRPLVDIMMSNEPLESNNEEVDAFGLDSSVMAD